MDTSVERIVLNVTLKASSSCLIEANSLGRILALVLRHAPEKFDVEMDLNGWVNSRELSEAIQNKRRHFHWLRGWHFEAIANADTKGRYQVEGEMIRATYGHSIELELDLPTDDIPEALYWPCDPETVSTHMELAFTAVMKNTSTYLRQFPMLWKQDMFELVARQFWK